MKKPSRLSRSIGPYNRYSHEARCAIIAAKVSGLSPIQISSLFDVPVRSVRNILQSFESFKLVGRRPGSGRKRKTSPEDDIKIVVTLKRNPHMTIDQFKVENPGINLSDRRIRARIQEDGQLGSYIQRKRPYLSEKNRLERLKWAKEHLNWTIDQWAKVLWSDESPFTVRFNRRSRVWLIHGDTTNPAAVRQTVKADKKMMVWGCFSRSGVGKLVVINGILDKEKMKALLSDELKPSANALFGDSDWIFQQDNDPKHTSKVVKQFLVDEGIITMKWPSQSPDLNPIENLWGWLDLKCKDRHLKNHDQLFQTLNEAWNAFTTEELSKLVDSMPKRCKEVIEQNGKWISY